MIESIWILFNTKNVELEIETKKNIYKAKEQKMCCLIWSSFFRTDAIRLKVFDRKKEILYDFLLSSFVFWSKKKKWQNVFRMLCNQVVRLSFRSTHILNKTEIKNGMKRTIIIYERMKTNMRCGV